MKSPKKVYFGKVPDKECWKEKWDRKFSIYYSGKLYAIISLQFIFREL